MVVKSCESVEESIRADKPGKEVQGKDLAMAVLPELEMIY